MFVRIGESKTIGQRIESEIERVIRNGSLMVGEKLPTEMELCEKFNVGRNSLREALRSLESRGLIRIEKGRGMFVNEFSLNSAMYNMNLFLEMNASKNNLYQVIKLRKLFEPAIAAEASLKRNDKDLAVLEQTISDMKLCASDDLDKEALLDNKFHKAIASATHNFAISLIMGPIYSLMPRFINYVYGKSDPMKAKTLDYHIRIYEAIKRGEAKEAETIMEEHLIETTKYFNAFSL